MSDISITFEWYTYPVIIAFIGWPGLAIGAVLGGLAWQRHRVWGALIGAIVGCLAWAGGFYLWR
jgi:hypothetical protein